MKEKIILFKTYLIISLIVSIGLGLINIIDIKNAYNSFEAYALVYGISKKRYILRRIIQLFFNTVLIILIILILGKKKTNKKFICLGMLLSITFWVDILIYFLYWKISGFDHLHYFSIFF